MRHVRSATGSHYFYPLLKRAQVMPSSLRSFEMGNAKVYRRLSSHMQVGSMPCTSHWPSLPQFVDDVHKCYP